MEQKGSEVLWSGGIPSRVRLGIGEMGCTTAVLGTLSWAEGEDLGGRATHSGLMLGRWMGVPASRGVPILGLGCFPPYSCFHWCSGGEKAGAASGSGVPPAPHSHGSSAGVPSRFGIWVQLWFLEHSVSLGLCPRCSSSAAPQPRSLPETPKFPKPAAEAELRRGGGCSCPRSLSRRRSGPRWNLPLSSQSPWGGWGSMSSRPLLDGSTLR